MHIYILNSLWMYNFSIMFSISRCTQICIKMKRTSLNFFSLVWARKRTKDQFLKCPLFRGSTVFQFCTFCSSAVFCLQSYMGRVSYLFPPNILVDVPSLPTVWRIGIRDSGTCLTHSAPGPEVLKHPSSVVIAFFVLLKHPSSTVIAFYEGR